MKALHRTRFRFAAVSTLLACAAQSKAAVVVQQGFESTAGDNDDYTAAITSTNGTSAVVTATSASSFPASTPAAMGTHDLLSYRVTTTTLAFDKVNLTGLTDAQVSLRVAAPANVATNGEDLGDTVSVTLPSPVEYNGRGNSAQRLDMPFA